MNINNKTHTNEVRARKSQSTRTSKKLQFWTNQSKTKYAISFENESHYLETTDPKVLRYSTLIAESDGIFKGYEYNWKSILNKWIVIHKFAIGFRRRSKFPFTTMMTSEDRSRIKNTPSTKTMSKHHSTLQLLMAKNIQ